METKRLNIREDIIKGLPRTAMTPPQTATQDSPTIRNCKILGFLSRNNRVYTREAVAKAAKKYEGVKVNLDHSSGAEPRKFCERFGRMVNVRMTPEGLYGDLQYNPAHPLAEAFRWWVANDPAAIGLSHNATAEVKTTAEGGELVTEIRDVDSVDLVADPATTKGLLESYHERKVMDPMETMNQDPAAVNALPTQEADGDGDFAAHLGNAILAIINDAGLDADAKKKKVLLALKLMDEGEGEGETEPELAPEPLAESGDEATDGDEVDEGEEEIEEDGDEATDGDEVDEGEEEIEEDGEEAALMEAALLGPDEEPKPLKASESVDTRMQQLQAELDGYRVQEAMRTKKNRLLRQCKSAGIPGEAVTPVFVSQLLRLKETAWPKLIADRRAVAKRGSKPVSTPAAVAGDSYDTFVNELLAN